MTRGLEKKDPVQSVVRTAEQPGQVLNIDLCFVPQEHLTPEKLPAVSGSSGHLVIQRQTGPEEVCWPGQVFKDGALTFEEAMQEYIQETLDRQIHSRTPSDPQIEPSTHWRQEWEGREERHRVLQQRRQEDADWKKAKEKHRQARLTYQNLPKAQRKQQQEAWRAQQAEWMLQLGQHRSQKQNRKGENQAWHERNRRLKEDFGLAFPHRSWIAVLVVIDNCTRQCLGLPVFPSGSKVTAQEVTQTLAGILPAGLRFLISDQGGSFRTKRMADLAQEKGFSQVFIYRHRPQSNGIAERFVQTFKRWLRSETWRSAEELQDCISRFQPEYNDRPHVGLAIPGLSPNEFANRIGLM